MKFMKIQVISKLLNIEMFTSVHTYLAGVMQCIVLITTGLNKQDLH